MNPWLLELIVVRDSGYGDGERRTLARDTERGLLTRLRKGVSVKRTAFETMSPEDRHIVLVRALAAALPEPPVFSHWSAALLHGLPVLRHRLERVHTTVDERRERGQDGVAAHLFPLSGGEVACLGDVLATSLPRTVVDVAGAGPFDEGVMVGDAALRSGVGRDLLEQAIDVAGPRRSARRIGETVAFAHPGGESAAESGSRVNMMRIGIEPPELQHRMVLDDGSEIYLDFFFPTPRVGGEADGDSKYLDPELAPHGAGRVLLREKRREDEARTRLAGMARWGWPESRQRSLLERVLRRVGVLPARPRATLADYAASARFARPRFVPRRTVVQR